MCGVQGARHNPCHLRFFTPSFLPRKTANGSNSRRRASTWSQFLFLFSRRQSVAETEKPVEFLSKTPKFLEMRKKEKQMEVIGLGVVRK
ncbi:hypothetical protein MUK42_27952 [Musa troglodytarum]|uniref:Uncharacterized protein n=1 Tax=Musa troglodytarum TaxID=320322 RepID=A0A9E7G2C1_9LILI|nr:hypothetical protein MUK42_27952 [Musa troglodytarum]